MTGSVHSSLRPRPSGKHVPRSLYVDLEPNVINEVRTGLGAVGKFCVRPGDLFRLALRVRGAKFRRD